MNDRIVNGKHISIMLPNSTSDRGWNSDRDGGRWRFTDLSVRRVGPVIRAHYSCFGQNLPNRMQTRNAVTTAAPAAKFKFVGQNKSLACTGGIRHLGGSPSAPKNTRMLSQNSQVTLEKKPVWCQNLAGSPKRVSSTAVFGGARSVASDQLFPRQGTIMPLFEVETDAHIIITWAENEDTATVVANDSYPSENIVRLTKRPRDSWVISKGLLGIREQKLDPCSVARECLSKAAGDKVHAIRLYMQQTGNDLEQARKAVESNMLMGW